MLANSLTKWLRDNRRSLLIWAFAIAGVGGMYAAFWPTIDNPAMRDALANYPKALMDALNFNDIATPAGYLNASVYGLVVGVLVVVFAIQTGAKAISGEEEMGRLDLVLSYPITRNKLALQRLGAFLVAALGVSLLLWLVILAETGPARLEDISVGHFAAMHLHLFLFATLFGSLAFGVGAATGRRGWAIGVGSAVAVFGFAANGVLSQISGLEWTRDLSPFQWLNGGSPLQNGVQGWDVLIMAGLAVLFAAAGLWGLNRRDIAV
ncbi:MAG: ABC transporter permease subunit [Acidimicrobiia bacterium]